MVCGTVKMHGVTSLECASAICTWCSQGADADGRPDKPSGYWKMLCSTGESHRATALDFASPICTWCLQGADTDGHPEGELRGAHGAHQRHHRRRLGVPLHQLRQGFPGACGFPHGVCASHRRIRDPSRFTQIPSELLSTSLEHSPGCHLMSEFIARCCCQSCKAAADQVCVMFCCLLSIWSQLQLCGLGVKGRCNVSAHLHGSVGLTTEVSFYYCHSYT